MNGEAAIVRSRRSGKIFRENCVRPWVKQNWKENQNAHHGTNHPVRHTTHQKITEQLPRHLETTEQIPETLGIHAEAYEGIQTEESSIGKITKKDHERSVEIERSRAQVFQGLLNNGTFIRTNRSDIPPDTRVFVYCFLEEPKPAEKGLRRKRILVAQCYSDEGVTHIPTKAPTIQRSTQLLVLILAE